ncbi:MAG: ribosomal-processing cysteine protease Prp [Lachnospiraceae bacterium]|nr:ribosomal-processing cysteine protease Prp [Lachnospiraceae bacterium]
MITVSIFKNKAGKISGFSLAGHAGYAEEGEDIVCSAVTALSFNTVNSIEAFCNDKIVLDVADENEGGYLRLDLKNPSEEALLLLKSFELGIKNICDEYGEHVNIVYSTQ